MAIKKILIMPCKKEAMSMGKKEKIIVKQRKYHIEDPSKDYHTEYGVVAKEDLAKKDGSLIQSKKGREFILLTPNFLDSYKRIKRQPQTIPLKDIGLIIAETGIGKNSVVVDAGAGSGALSCFLANIVKEVITYEVREDFLSTVKENILALNLQNIKVKHKDIYEGIDEENVDLVTFDLPEPWRALKEAEKALKINGFLVCYNITVPQLIDFIEEVVKNKAFLHEKTIEVITREWEIDKRRVRPKTQMLGHSGFLTFVRKIG